MSVGAQGSIDCMMVQWERKKIGVEVVPLALLGRDETIAQLVFYHTA